MRILLSNDDGWDAPGLAALKTLAAELGEVWVVAPAEPHSYAGHRITTDVAMRLTETAPREFHLAGTPADCVRVGLTSIVPEAEWVLAGINRGGNLGADIFISGTVAAAREAALLGRRALAISQYVRRGMQLDWEVSQMLARPVVEGLMAENCPPKGYWNVNLPHVDPSVGSALIHCEPDNEPLDVRFDRDGHEFRYAGSYPSRPRTAGRDVDLCFGGSITVSLLRLL